MATRQANLGHWTARGRLPGWGPFLVVDRFVSHPLLAPRAVEQRDFQLAIAARAVQESTLVVLPTGLGKTIIAVLAAAEVLRRGGKVLMLAPTRPLVVQHAESFRRLLPGVSQAMFTGSEADRPERFAGAQTVFATPQGVANDLEQGLYTLEEVGLLIFDEAHRAVGDYAYVPIAKSYRKQRTQPLVLGLTASPGSQRKRVEEVVGHLGVVVVESRKPGDEDVVEHVHDIDVAWVKVKLTAPMREAQKLLNALLRERVKKLQRSGFVVHKPADQVGKGDLIGAGDAIRKRLARRRMGFLFGAMSNQGVAIQAYHTLELVETQGVAPFRAYMAKLRGKDKLGKSERAFLADTRLQEAENLLEGVTPSHPKLEALAEVLRQELATHPEARAIVFAQYRDTIDSILKVLVEEGIPAERFVGQATRGEDKGMSQPKQQEALARFRAGAFKVLVASSVAEEGLDIPQVELVVFYEPVVSEIRSIQRRGRTGRAKAGRVVVLVATKTRDEAYLRAEANRERRMEALVDKMGEEREAADAELATVDPEEPA